MLAYAEQNKLLEQRLNEQNSRELLEQQQRPSVSSAQIGAVAAPTSTVQQSGQPPLPSSASLPSPSDLIASAANGPAAVSPNAMTSGTGQHKQQPSPQQSPQLHYVQAVSSTSGAAQFSSSPPAHQPAFPGIGQQGVAAPSGQAGLPTPKQPPTMTMQPASQMMAPGSQGQAQQVPMPPVGIPPVGMQPASQMAPGCQGQAQQMPMPQQGMANPANYQSVGSREMLGGAPAPPPGMTGSFFGVPPPGGVPAPATPMYQAQQSPPPPGMMPGPFFGAPPPGTGQGALGYPR